MYLYPFIQNKMLIELSKHFRNGGNYTKSFEISTLSYLLDHKIPRSSEHHGANWRLYTALLRAILVKYVVYYGISLKPCNTGSGYNPILWVLQCCAKFPEVFDASLVVVAHCIVSSYDHWNIIIFSYMLVFLMRKFWILTCLATTITYSQTLFRT